MVLGGDAVGVVPSAEEFRLGPYQEAGFDEYAARSTPTSLEKFFGAEATACFAIFGSINLFDSLSLVPSE